jgi:uncharacterized membrane protein YgcG
MKKTTKNYLKLGILLLGISFVLINCENDPIPILEDEHTHNVPFKITRLTYSDIQYNVTVTNTLDELNSAISAAKSKTKSDDFDVYDFIIDTETVKHIEHQDGIHHSYTFPIIRDVDYGYLENLLLAYDEKAGYNAFLIKYDFTHDEKEDYSNGLEVDLTGKVKVIELDIANLNIDFRLKYVSMICIYIITENCKLDNHNDGNGYGNCSAYESSVETVCSDGGSGGSTGDGGDTGSGGDTGTGDIHDGGSGSTGGSSGGSNITSPTLNKSDLNCESLNDLLGKSGANISQVINSLKDNLDDATECGESLTKSNGSYDTDWIKPTGTHSIKIPVGGDVYGAIHTHPSTGYEMFSYNDVFGLLALYDNASSSNQSEVTIMMMRKVNGFVKTYALKINNFTLFKGKLYTDAGFTPSTPNAERILKLKAMDEVLGTVYSNNTNFERAFLNYFKDFNITLYKSDAYGNSFNKLSLADPDSSTSKVNESYCGSTDIM